MAKKAVGLALAAIMITGAAAQAQVDFGKMLSSLTFGEPDQEKDEGQLPSPSDDADGNKELEQLPETGGALLGDAPIDERQIPEVGPSLYSGDALPLEAYDILDQPHETLPEVPVPPIASDTSLQDLNGPTPATETATGEAAGAGDHSLLLDEAGDLASGSGRVDWDSVLSNDGCEGENCRGEARSGCAVRQALSPFPARVARPVKHLSVPNLPPPTSAAASYRTPACYRDLWGTFAAEREAACQHHHKHLNEQCDCVNGNGKCCNSEAQYPFPR